VPWPSRSRFSANALCVACPVLSDNFHDVTDTPFGLRLIIGDSKGCGLPAARLATATLAGFRETAHTTANCLA